MKAIGALAYIAGAVALGFGFDHEALALLGVAFGLHRNGHPR